MESATSEHPAECEDKYRALLGSIDEAFCILELRVDAQGRIADLVFSEVSSSFERQTGLADVPGRSVSDLLPSLERDCRDVCARVARTGEPERVERYLQGADRWFRIHYSRVGVSESRLVAVVLDDISERRHAKLAIQNHRALVAELQHRVHNIMSVVRSITTRTGAEARSVAEFTSLMTGRLQTLARVQTHLTRTSNVGVDVRTILLDGLRAAAPNANQYELCGSDCVLSPLATEVMSLVINELATNASKCGALSAPGGHVDVQWKTIERGDVGWLYFDWVERRTQEVSTGTLMPGSYDVGRELVEERIPYELSGFGSLAIESGGVRCHIHFPLQDLPSVLATDVPG